MSELCSSDDFSLSDSSDDTKSKLVLDRPKLLPINKPSTTSKSTASEPEVPKPRKETVILPGKSKVGIPVGSKLKSKQPVPLDTSAIATRTRAKVQATEVPRPSKTQGLGRSKELSLAEDDDSDDEQSDPPIFRQRRSTLPNLEFHPKQMVENPRIPDSQGAVAGAELR